MMNNEFDSFSVCFNMMKIKYAIYDTSLSQLNFLQPGDQVNVFINIESVLKAISTIKDVDRKIYSCKDFNEIMISNFINLAAHYRKFFRGNNLNTKVYMYMTDITSDGFNEQEINEDFRSYYLVKYLKNPKYLELGEKLRDVIIPYVQQICNFINGVYFINAKGIESSLIPYMISKIEPNRKNLVITGDYIDTQYSLIPNFICHYLRRSSTSINTSCNLLGHISSLLRKPENECDEEINLYRNKSFYMLLFAVLGETYRSVEGITGIGNITLMKMLNTGLKDSVITMNTANIQTIAQVFPEQVQKDVIDNFSCLDIESMIRNITRSQLATVESQIVDKFDHNGLMTLNSTKFFEHPLMLEELTI